MNDGGNTPIFTSQELQQMGYRIAVWQSFLPLAAIFTLEKALSVFLDTGSSKIPKVPLASFTDFSDLIGFEKGREFNDHWSD